MQRQQASIMPQYYEHIERQYRGHLFGGQGKDVGYLFQRDIFEWHNIRIYF